MRPSSGSSHRSGASQGQPDGSPTERRVLSEVFDRGVHQIQRFEADDIQARIFGDAAVVTGRTRGAGNVRGADYDVTIRFTDVFIRRDGQPLVGAEGPFSLRWGAMTFTFEGVMAAASAPARSRSSLTRASSRIWLRRKTWDGIRTDWREAGDSSPIRQGPQAAVKLRTRRSYVQALQGEPRILG